MKLIFAGTFAASVETIVCSFLIAMGDVPLAHDERGSLIKRELKNLVNGA